MRGTLAAFLLVLSVANAQSLPAEFQAAANFTDIPAGLLYAVATAESGRVVEGQLRPWPWTLNVEGEGFYFESREAQFAALMRTLSAGRSVDIGPMQLNWHWQFQRLDSPWTATDPAYNVFTASRLLRDLYDAQGANASWAQTVGQYHRASRAPQHRLAANRYATRVLRLWAAQ